MTKRKILSQAWEDASDKVLELPDIEPSDMDKAISNYCEKICVGPPCACTRIKDFINGYNQALVDVRGDSE